MKIIDAHSHLWLRQDTSVLGQPIRTTTRGRSLFFGEEMQMLPPFMIDGRNTAEVFLSNMDYAQVSAAVVTQEFIDGNQNSYLADVVDRYPDRFRVMGYADYRQPGWFAEASRIIADARFSGMAIPGHRFIDERPRLSLLTDEMLAMMKQLEAEGKVLSLCLADDDRQLGEAQELIAEFPDLKIAIGHFGMVTSPGWLRQIDLARSENVYIESGGITWLFNSEFYPFTGANRAIREAADRVGMDKLMWGSDYPRTITAITYRMSYDFFLKSDAFRQEEKELFLYRNAQRFYGFGELVDLPYIKNMSE